MQQEERKVGSYRLHKHLEHGTIADAYLATHISTSEQVIVKVFQARMSEEQLAQCMVYLHVCVRLEHPGILHLLDFGEEGSEDTRSLFLVIDAPGETLGQRHPQGLPLPLDTLALYISQIAAALQFAHDQHVLHLDLRPDQLFVGPNGKIKLDYTCRLLYSVSPTFIPSAGHYMPHEVPSPVSDQYALATLIYEWLGGPQLFSDIASEAADTQRSLAVPGEHVANIWSRVEPVLGKALSLEPTQRYESVQAFADAFVLALNVGAEAAKLKERIQGQRSFGGSALRMGGAVSSMTLGSLQVEVDWHNPFSAGFIFTSHNVRTLVFSPDSKRLAFNSGEPTIYVAEIAEQGTLFTYKGHTDAVSAVAWSPDGQTIGSFSSNGTTGNIQIWEATTRKLVSTYDVLNGTRELQWSPDGKFIATGGWDRAVHIWQPFTGKALLTYSGHTSFVSSLAWSPDGTRIASTGDSSIHVWEAATGALICIYRGHFGNIHAVAWSPDGTMIASGGDDTTIQIWDAASRAPLFIHRASASKITAIGWSPDGNYIIIGTYEGSIQVCSVKDGKSVFQYHPHIMHTKHMGSVAWSPDLNILAIGGEDRRVEIANRINGEVLLCRAPAVLIEKIGQSQVQRGEMVTMSSSSSVSIGETTTTTTTTTTTAPSKPPVVRTTTRKSRTVRVWGGKDGRDTVIYFGHKSVVKPVAWSPDSSRIASGEHDGSMHVWDVVTSTTIFIYHGHLDPVVAVAWSPDGTRVASGSLDHTVKIWDLLTGQEILTYHGHKSFVQSIAWSPDSTRVVSGSEDNTAQVWDASNGKTILTYKEHTAAINGVDWSIDGQHIATGSDDQTVHIWDAATGNNDFVYRNHAVAVLVVAWSPDGKRIASGSARLERNFKESVHELDDEARIHIWTANADQVDAVYVQEEHMGRYHNIDSITWSPDGQMIAAPDMSQARIYETSAGEAIGVIMNHQHGQQPDNLLNIAWSPDGTRIAGSLSNGRVQVWPAREQASW